MLPSLYILHSFTEYWTRMEIDAFDNDISVIKHAPNKEQIKER